MTHCLLILGTLEEFVLLVKKAKERGIYTIVCDGYPDGPARQYADEAFTIPVTDIDAIASLCREKRVDGILTSFSDLLLECMVKIAAKAEIPCYLKPEQLCWYRDKAAAKELLASLGLPAPKFARFPAEKLINFSVFSEAEDSEKAPGDLCFPVVTKPVDKYGSRGIYISHNMEELKRAAEKTAEFCDGGEILLEEYNDGYEFNMMTWVLDGQVQVISIADREKTFYDPCEIPISTRNVYPSCLYEKVEPEAKALLQSYIQKTGQREGALSMQFFWKPGQGIQVCEIAARFFGYEHDLTDIAFGFNIEDLLLNYLYDPEALRQMFAGHRADCPEQIGAVLYYQGKLLPIGEQNSLRESAGHPAVVSSMIFYEDGETVAAHGPNPYVALFYVRAASRRELDQITEEFNQKITVKTPDGEEVLYANQIPDYPI